MSERYVEKIRAGVDAFNRRDFDAALAPLSDDVRWERFLTRADTGTPVVRGKRELRESWEGQVEAVDLRVEPERFVDAGTKVIVTVRMVVHGTRSDIALSQRVTWVWTFDDSDGLAVTVDAYATLDEALRAAGVEGP